MINEIKLSNSRSSNLRLFFEPWAEEMVLLPHQEIDIEQRHTGSSRLHCEFAEDGIVIYGNVSSKIVVLIDGKKVWESY